MAEDRDVILNQAKTRAGQVATKAGQVGVMARRLLLPHPENNYHPHWLRWPVVMFIGLALAAWKAYTLRLLGVSMNLSEEAVTRTLSGTFYIITLLALLNILVYPRNQQKEAIWASLTLVVLTFIFMIF